MIEIVEYCPKVLCWWIRLFLRLNLEWTTFYPIVYIENGLNAGAILICSDLSDSQHRMRVFYGQTAPAFFLVRRAAFPINKCFSHVRVFAKLVGITRDFHLKSREMVSPGCSMRNLS